jgi:diaminobutyrate-2-oxoglutarate transaminase
MRTVVEGGEESGWRAEEFGGLESAVRIYCRTFDSVFARARGAFVFDCNGRRHIDFLSGAGVLNYGHNNPRIKRAIIDYLEDDGILHSLDLHTTAKLTFLRRLRDVILAPRGLDYRVQFCGPTGADAVEAALKLARKITNRRTVVAFTNAYHGMTLGALAVTANPHKRASAGVPLDHVLRVPFAGQFGPEVDTIAVLSAALARCEADRPAAIIVETVQAEGGINVASPTWLRDLSELALSQGILLIVDDIQVGCGRTGQFFSFERAGIRPDIVCVSKAIGGIGMPIALTLIRPEFDHWKPGDHTGTFRGNNLAFVAAAAALDYWRDGGLEAEIARHGRHMRDRLNEIAAHHPEHCTEVRGIGMIQGFAWRDAHLGAAISRAAFARGLIVETCGPDGEVTKLLPPLVIRDDELEEGLSILSDAVDQATSQCGSRPMPRQSRQPGFAS